MAATQATVKQQIGEGDLEKAQKIADQFNSVSIGMNVKQASGPDVLSDATMSIGYPAVERNMGNIINYQSFVVNLLGVIEFAAGRAARTAPETLPDYTHFCNSTATKFTELGQKISSGSL